MEPGPCVRVAPPQGERTRSRLAEAGLLDGSREIHATEGSLLIPVTDSEKVPEDLEVISAETPAREGQTTPADLLSWDPSYERVGDVAVIDEDDPERARELTDAIVDSDLPLETVLNKRSPIEGTERVREWAVLAGEGTTVRHREYGYEYALDLAQVYFSPRLATERHRVASQVEAGEQAFDMFAGVGPFVIPFADRGATCVAVDVNPAAIEYLRENAERNGVSDRITALCGDVREVAGDYTNWADRIVMNLPHSGAGFLETAVGLAGERCRLHYYDIQHEDDPFGPGEAAIRAVAGSEYDVSVAERRVVRSYAPHELNVCLDIDLERA